jgi:hypothetical protein
MDQLLIAFSFSWMVVAAVVGFYVGLLHERNLVSLESVANTGDWIEYHRRLDAYKWKVTIHAHSFLFGVVGILVGLSMARMGYSAPMQGALAYGLISAPILWFAGSWRRIMPLMGIGDLLLLAGVVASAYGLLVTL